MLITSSRYHGSIRAFSLPKFDSFLDSKPSQQLRKLLILVNTSQYQNYAMDDGTSATLLGIALELRLEIYEYCCEPWVAHEDDNFPAITSVCHQSREESLPVAFEKWFHFVDVRSVCQWTIAGSPRLLKLVKNLDCNWCWTNDLQKQTQLTNRREVKQRRQRRFGPANIWPPRHPELHTVKEALSALQGLELLEIELPIGKQDASQEHLLVFLSTSSPHIKTLSTRLQIAHMSCLEAFRNLTALTWSGYSLSTPDETLLTLNTLPLLSKMSITGPLIDYQHQDSHCGFTPRVLRQMRPLKDFSICHLGIVRPSEHSMANMLEALSAHRSSLVHLSVNVHYDPHEDGDWPALEEALNIASTFSLLTIKLFFHSVPKNYLKLQLDSLIGPTVRRCDIKLLHGRHQRNFVLVELEHSMSWQFGVKQSSTKLYKHQGPDRIRIKSFSQAFTNP